MNCIIVDDEPLAREAIQQLVSNRTELCLVQTFSSANSASKFLINNDVNLIFLDIQMPGTNGIQFAKMIPKNTLVIFTTAYGQYALEGFEVEAVDYLIKPVAADRFNKAVNKAVSYHKLLAADQTINKIQHIAEDYFFVKAERKFVKIYFKDILFIEGLKDYVVMQTDDQKIITNMNIKTIHEQLPPAIFVRIGKSYIINVGQIGSFDNNTVFIHKYEIPIGDSYRNNFFDEYVLKKLLSK